VLKSIQEQVILSRSEEIESDFKKIFSNRNRKISDCVREFHFKFVHEIPVLVNWEKIFGNDMKYSNISYYRIDSYLLADAPLIYKPVISFIQNNINPEYYGVEIDGLKLLADNNAVRFEVLHPSKYPIHSSSLEFILYLKESGKLPYYMDVFEDFLAAFWIRNCPIDNKEKFREKFNNFIERPHEFSFDYFIENYSKLLMDNDQNYREIVKKIPEKTQNLPASLRYRNLNTATIERLVKIKLLNDFYLTVTGNNLVDFDQIMNDYKTIFKNYGNNKLLNYYLARYIFVLWQSCGAFWSYSEGNAVDFSLRDLSLEMEFSEVTKPDKIDDAVRVPILKKLSKIIEETNIDDANSIKNCSEKRTTLLTRWFEDFHRKNEGMAYDEFSFYIQTGLQDIQNDNLHEDINNELKRIIGRDKIGKDIFMACLKACPAVLAHRPDLGILVSLLSLYHDYFPTIDRYGIVSLEESNQIFGKIQMAPENSVQSINIEKMSYNCHVVNIPYIRSDSIFSKSQLGSTGYSNP